MSEESHTLLVLPRGRRGELRVSRERFEGRAYTRLHLWYPSEPHGELRPSRQSVKIRDSELPELVALLGCIERRVAAGNSAQQPSKAKDGPPPRTESPYPSADELEGVF